MFPPGGCEHDGLLVPGYDRLEEVQQHAVLALASHLQEGELQGVGDLQKINLNNSIHQNLHFIISIVSITFVSTSNLTRVGSESPALAKSTSSLGRVAEKRTVCLRTEKYFNSAIKIF